MNPESLRETILLVERLAERTEAQAVCARKLLVALQEFVLVIQDGYWELTQR